MGHAASRNKTTPKRLNKILKNAPTEGLGRLTSEKLESKLFKREPQDRIFVNRSLYLEKIKFFGFDMDYTLAVYQSPEYESLSFRLLVNRLLEMGYPSEIADYEYDPTFPVRGLWFDSKYGTLLKMDPFGHILVAVKGFKVLSSAEIKGLYQTNFLEYEEGRTQIMNTLFDLPEMYLLACLIDYFTNSSAYTKELTAVKCGDQYMSFTSIHQDVCDCMNWVHTYGTLKEKTVEMLEKLVQRDERLPIFLDRIRESGGKTFLVTNSKYAYTNKVMSFLLGSPFEKKNPKSRDWLSYFDYIVVDANKPGFFNQGRTLREIDLKTGKSHIGFHTGPLQQGNVYSGGNCGVFSDLIGCKGRDVLYIGDHIFGDILMSKTKRGWRTFLVIPELVQEIFVWTSKRNLYEILESLEAELSNAYRNMDSASTTAPDTKDIQNSMMEVMHAMDMEYGMLGSLFKSGSRQTFFASQVTRFADLYSGTFLNLLNYPFCYLFKAPAVLMPHESTVQHAGVYPDNRIFARSRSIVPASPGHPAQLTLPDVETKGQRESASQPRTKSTLPHLKAETPKTITHHIDVIDEEDSKSIVKKLIK